MHTNSHLYLCILCSKPPSSHGFCTSVNQPALQQAKPCSLSASYALSDMMLHALGGEDIPTPGVFYSLARVESSPVMERSRRAFVEKT